MDDTQARDLNVPRLADGCTLDTGELDERLGEIAQLASWALRERHDEVGRTVLVFDPAAGSQVRDLVRRERDCCGHLEFSIEETEAVLRVTIRQQSDVGPGGIEPPSDGL
jgi:hypothetical protein